MLSLMSATKILRRVKSEWQLFTKLDVVDGDSPNDTFCYQEREAATANRRRQSTDGEQDKLALMTGSLVRLIPATDAAPPHCIRKDGRPVEVTGWPSRLNKLVSGTLRLCRLPSSHSEASERRHPHDGEWRVRFAPACGQPSPTFFPPCLVWVLSCELRWIHYMCNPTNHHRDAAAAPLPEASSSWFSCPRTFNLRCCELGSDDAISVSPPQLTCTTLTAMDDKITLLLPTKDFRCSLSDKISPEMKPL